MAGKRKRAITDEEALMLRRVIFIEMAALLPLKFVATVFGRSAELVRSEVRKGHPADLDPELAASVARGTRKVVREWLEEKAAREAKAAAG